MRSSIFSSFDVACTEFFAQNGFFPSSTMTIKGENKTGVGQDVMNPIIIEETETDGKQKHDLSPGTRKPLGRGQATPRLAPELDGLHCFETIVYPPSLN
uniref:Uncharacterized protein n=1 Tax=Nelumbo nucifera TaxID=4432 RepID=A0A822XGU7_NELNU|nr:TPA_asm: hypothetical protein HUJ06_019518 [Nelumbo nucifera]